MAKYSVFNGGGKFLERSLSGNLTGWMFTQSKGLTRKGVEEARKSMRAYVYLVLTSQVQVRSSIVGNAASVVDAQQVLIACLLN